MISNHFNKQQLYYELQDLGFEKEGRKLVHDWDRTWVSLEPTENEIVVAVSWGFKETVPYSCKVVFGLPDKWKDPNLYLMSVRRAHYCLDVYQKDEYRSLEFLSFLRQYEHHLMRRLRQGDAQEPPP